MKALKLGKAHGHSHCHLCFAILLNTFLVVQTYLKKKVNAQSTHQAEHKKPGTGSLKSLFKETTLSSKTFFLTWRILNKILESKTTYADRSTAIFVFFSGSKSQGKGSNISEKDGRQKGNTV